MVTDQISTYDALYNGISGENNVARLDEVQLRARGAAMHGEHGPIADVVVGREVDRKCGDLPHPRSREKTCRGRRATPGNVWVAKSLVKVAPPSEAEVAKLGSSTILVGLQNRLGIRLDWRRSRHPGWRRSRAGRPHSPIRLGASLQLASAAATYSVRYILV
jgi:hypothetical protein